MDRATTECGFILKPVRDMILTNSQMHYADKHSQHRLIIWPVLLNGWVFVYELSGCGFESSCSHLNITSVLLAFNDILFALSQIFNSFKSWLTCRLSICQIVEGLYYLHNDLHHYTWLLCLTVSKTFLKSAYTPQATIPLSQAVYSSLY